MKKQAKLFLILILLFISNLQSQDIITKKDGKEIKVIIKEVTKNNIKYVLYNDPNEVLFSIDKILLKEVKFAYGANLDVKNPEKDINYYSEDKTSIYMLNFSAFANNTLGLSYEKNLKLGQSIMGELKIYGFGVTTGNESKRSGVGFDFYYKLKTQSLFNKEAYRPEHILHGAYFSPVIGFSTGDLYLNNTVSPDKISHTLMHFGIQYGNQWIIQRKISVDASFGVHYYLGNSNEDDFEKSIQLGNMVGEDNILLAFNLRIGFLSGKTYSEK